MRSASPLRRAALVLSIAVVTLTPAIASSQLRRTAPSSLTDAEFWEIFTTMSETGGSFPSENFVSNEMTFQHVIPKLLGTVTKDGVYLGVGPEQNFTYIANLKPRMAIIFDIRRQNAMAHLMYKALFEMSPTRAEFVSRLFSRPAVARTGVSVKVNDLFISTSAAARSDSAYMANLRAIFGSLVDRHRFALTPGDSAAIEHLVEVFYDAGPNLNYGYRLGRSGTMPSTYPDYGTLQNLTNADSVQMAYLASEELYRSVRDLHLRNMIVPVVGDFAGPKAIRAVGDYLRQRSMTVSAFYLSNVEQYLFQNGVAERFYENAAMLPIDSGSTFIRSVPINGGGGAYSFSVNGFGTTGGFGGGAIGSLGGGMIRNVMITDSNGSRMLRITQDSAGYTITRTFRDSAGTMVLQKVESNAPTAGVRTDTTLDRRLRELAAQRDTQAIAASARPMPFAVQRPNTFAFAGSLTSGLAPMRATLAEFAAGKVLSYRDIIAMTRVDGWKR